jgi:predicted  nucleic acid-binding Zn-ribbon protein
VVEGEAAGTAPVGDAVQEALLRVQEHDTQLDQLRHRRATLPERSQLAELEARLASMAVELETVGGRKGELDRSLRRLEDDVAAVEAKAKEVDRKLYSGTVSAPRELQTMQEEIASLKRRQSSLEDQLLEVMELTEPVAADLERLEEERARAEDEGARLRAAIVDTEAEIDAETERVNGARAELAAGIPAELLATYESLRGRLAGVAVARLEGNRCMGCHLTLPATEVDQIRRQPPDAIVRHEECGRILVR